MSEIINRVSNIDKERIKYKTRPEIEAWLATQNIRDYELGIDSSGALLVNLLSTVEMMEIVDLQGNKLNYFPVDFGSIEGTFTCSHLGLTTLSGVPQKIEGSFYASYNNLTSLEGGPVYVGGHYICVSNQITSLEFCPTNVPKNFDLASNKIVSLKYCPDTIGWILDLQDNEIKVIDNIPKSLGGYCCFYGNEDLSIDDRNMESYEKMSQAFTRYCVGIEKLKIETNLKPVSDMLDKITYKV